MRITTKRSCRTGKIAHSRDLVRVVVIHLDYKTDVRFPRKLYQIESNGDGQIRDWYHPLYGNIMHDNSHFRVDYNPLRGARRGRASIHHVPEGGGVGNVCGMVVKSRCRYVRDLGIVLGLFLVTGESRPLGPVLGLTRDQPVQGLELS